MNQKPRVGPYEAVSQTTKHTPKDLTDVLLQSNLNEMKFSVSNTNPMISMSTSSNNLYNSTSPNVLPPTNSFASAWPQQGMVSLKSSQNLSKYYLL